MNNLELFCKEMIDQKWDSVPMEIKNIGKAKFEAYVYVNIITAYRENDDLDNIAKLHGYFLHYIELSESLKRPEAIKKITDFLFKKLDSLEKEITINKKRF